MKTQLRRIRPRRHKVSPAKRGQKVIERDLVCQVDGRETQAPFVTVTVEKIVVAHCHIKQIPRLNAGRIEVIILGTWRWDVDSGRSILRRGAACQRRV